MQSLMGCEQQRRRTKRSWGEEGGGGGGGERRSPSQCFMHVGLVRPEWEAFMTPLSSLFSMIVQQPTLVRQVGGSQVNLCPITKPQRPSAASALPKVGFV